MYNEWKDKKNSLRSSICVRRRATFPRASSNRPTRLKPAADCTSSRVLNRTRSMKP